MKKLMSIAAFTLALCGCNTPNHIEGRLAVNSKINVATNHNQHAVLSAATYYTSLAMYSGGAEVRIHTTQGLVTFTVPQVQADSLGNLNIPASSIGQEFSLQGKIYQARQGIDRTRNEQCVHHYNSDYQCNNEQHCVTDSAGHETCGTENVCRWVQVPVYGTELVHEKGSQDSKNVDINLVKAGRALAKFSGGYDYSEQITSSEIVSGCSL